MAACIHPQPLTQLGLRSRCIIFPMQDQCWPIIKMPHTAISIAPLSFLGAFRCYMWTTRHQKQLNPTCKNITNVTLSDIWAKLRICKFWWLLRTSLAYISSEAVSLPLRCIISATKCILTDHRWAQCTGGSPNWMYHQLTSFSCLNMAQQAPTQFLTSFTLRLGQPEQIFP